VPALPVEATVTLDAFAPDVMLTPPLAVHA
jgi:hypothetical protein